MGVVIWLMRTLRMRFSLSLSLPLKYSDDMLAWFATNHSGKDNVAS